MHQILEPPSGIKIIIPWDRFTARGFGIATALVLLLLLFATFIDIHVEPYQLPKEESTPITLLNFGQGNGKRSHGNFTKDGAKRGGPQTKNPLEDASTSSPTKTKTPTNTDITQSNNIKPVKIASSENPSKHPSETPADKNIGVKNGTATGTGLGETGTGKGKGEGLGDNILWGGGGNRTAVYKPLPTFPPGASSAQIRIRFTVLPDGTVGSMIPMQKGDPLLERKAMEALRRWKFNPISGDVVMTGIIPFTFKLD